MDRVSKNTPPVSSSAFCPACSKPVDSLRAGQVAILDGAFRYFCDATCKGAYVEAVSMRPSLDAVTADPPPVASAARSAAPVVASGVREQVAPEPTDEPLAVAPAPAPRSHPRVDDSAASSGPHALDATEPDAEPDPDPGLDAPTDDDRAPSTLRSPDAAAEAVEPERGQRLDAAGLVALAAVRAVVAHAVASAPIVGVLAGVLAAVVSLAGEQAALLRLPLALLAAALVLARTGLAPREPGEPARWVILAPIVAAAIAATASMLVHDPHADAHASFVGLAAAASLAVDILLSRVRRDVVAARARTAAGLAVTARVVRSEGRQVGTQQVPEEIELVDAAIVKPGEQVVVDAGETIAVDGTVASGDAEIAPWLDATVVLRKREGEAVVAGAVVVSGRVRINATFSGPERAWLRLGQSVASRIDVAAPLVVFFRRMIERGAPASAALVAGAVYADNGSWLDVVLAGCGGGYALAAVAASSVAALAHARGHVAAQARGIVYKDASAFDAAARADVAVVCSRGTILLGEPEIVAVEAITKDGVAPNGWGRSTPSLAPGAPARADADIARVLAVAAGAEMSSTHPFASAILHEARARGIRPDNVRSALGHSGLGVTALASNGDRVIVGSRAFLLQEKVSVAIADARASELEAQGRSVLLVAVGGRLVGLLALQDGLRPGARAAVQRLHDARIEPVLLSGEARDTCETIARALDIEHVRPEILPADRGAEVRSLADGGRVVAALGHAASDDGALGAADLSVAMEAAGAAPGEWGVALASDDVRDAALALTVPRACRDRARTALVVGTLTQAASGLGIAFGIASPAIVPVLSVLAAAALVAIVRDPATAEGP